MYLVRRGNIYQNPSLGAVKNPSGATHNMKGIQNLSITFVNDNNRSARNKLSSMGGIMSSSEELMKEAQKAMPVIKDIVQTVDSPEPVQNYFLGGAVRAGLNFSL